MESDTKRRDRLEHEDTPTETLSRAERIEVLRELCRSDADVPDDMLDRAMVKLLERLGE